MFNIIIGFLHNFCKIVKQNSSLYILCFFSECFMLSGEHVWFWVFDDLPKIEDSTNMEWRESQLEEWFVTFSFSCNLVLKLKQKNIIFIMSETTKKISFRDSILSNVWLGAVQIFVKMFNDKSSGIALSLASEFVMQVKNKKRHEHFYWIKSSALLAFTFHSVANHSTFN